MTAKFDCDANGDGSGTYSEEASGIGDGRSHLSLCSNTELIFLDCLFILARLLNASVFLHCVLETV